MPDIFDQLEETDNVPRGKSEREQDIFDQLDSRDEGDRVERGIGESLLAFQLPGSPGALMPPRRGTSSLAPVAVGERIPSQRPDLAGEMAAARKEGDVLGLATGFREPVIPSGKTTEEQMRQADVSQRELAESLLPANRPAQAGAFMPAKRGTPSLTPVPVGESIPERPEEISPQARETAAITDALKQSLSELTTPENLGIMAATLGVGEAGVLAGRLTKLAETLPGILRAAQATQKAATLTGRGISGTFSFEGAKSIIEGASELKSAKTPEERGTAISKIVQGGAMLPAAVHAFGPEAPKRPINVSEPGPPPPPAKPATAAARPAEAPAAPKITPSPQLRVAIDQAANVGGLNRSVAAALDVAKEQVEKSAATKTPEVKPPAPPAGPGVTPKPGGETPDASEIQKTTEVHGDVRTQPGEGTGEVSAEKGGGGIQPPPEAAQGEVLLSDEERALTQNPKNQLQPGERLVRVRKPDGTTYLAGYDPEKFYDLTELGKGKIPQVGKLTSGGESHGLLGKGETIEELTPQGKEGETVEKAQGQKEEGVLVPAGEETPISMGGLNPKDEPVGVDPGNPDVYGIAARVRAERAKAGQVESVPPGQGISAPDSVEKGRALLAADPTAGEKALSAFEADPNKAVSAEGIAAARAHGENLALNARRVEEHFGTESPEYKRAWDALSDWDKRTKPMQTEWHKIGMAQQGETDIDTGSFTGLQRAYKENTGKDFTPAQTQKAKTLASTSKATDDAAAQAQKNLYDHLDKTQATNADQQAIDVANQTVREAAARLAKAQADARVIDTKAQQDIAAIQERAAEKAKAAAETTVRKAAVRAAKEEAKPATPQDVSAVQERAAAEAKAAADKTVRDAAAREAKKETEARVKQAELERKRAAAEEKAAQKALDAANLAVRQAATRAAKAATKERVAKADQSAYAWSKAKEYIAQGVDDFNDIRNRLATDLGMTVEQATKALASDKRAKFLTDELWKQQQKARLAKQQAKRWLYETTIPTYLRAIQSVPRILFSLKVGFHGTVALGTHAPMVAFQPRFWGTYVRDFGKMYKMVGSPAYYEMQVQDLVRRPNYTEARRAGLVNDPQTYEDFNSPETSKYFGNLTGMGNRGYTVLKILRQDMFDQQWNQLPRTARVGEVAEAIADAVNHATGVVKGKAPAGANLAFFAPRLEASRVAWLAIDPVKAAMSFADWKNATEGERHFAINQVKEKAWVAGTLFSLLALNEGFLSATDSKQHVNFTDPMRSDFLKFKAGGMDLSYGNAMISMARLPVRLYAIREGTGGKLKNLIHPDENSYTVLGEYARSQASPFASLASSLWFKSDWQNRPLPGSTRDVPKRLRAYGVKPYTWTEFWSEQVLPIPFEEALREVWGGMGMNDDQMTHMRKAMATIAVMGATGSRLVDDRNMEQPAQ